MNIGEVSKLTGFSVSAIRYYEEKGLIQSNGRRGLHRTFSVEVLQRLSVISSAQEVGMTLEEIKTIFPKNKKLEINKLLIKEQLKSIDNRLNHLLKLKKALEHVSKCSNENPLNCERFKRILNVSKKIKSKNR